MAFDDAVAARLRKVLARHAGVTERKMFGGLAFLLDGHMCCGVLDDRLVLRLGAEGASEALGGPHTRVMDFTGKAMTSMVYVLPEGYASEPALREWVRRAASFTSTLPPKGKPTRRGA